MLKALLIAIFVVSAGCCKPQIKADHIPSKMLPNEGKSEARKAGFGAAGEFVK